MKENEEIVQNEKTDNDNEWDFFDLAAVILHLVIFAACVIYYFVNAKPGIPVDMAIRFFGVLYFLLWAVTYIVCWVVYNVFVGIRKCISRLISKPNGSDSDETTNIDQEEYEAPSDMDSVNDNKED